MADGMLGGTVMVRDQSLTAYGPHVAGRRCWYLLLAVGVMEEGRRMWTAPRWIWGWERTSSLSSKLGGLEQAALLICPLLQSPCDLSPVADVYGQVGLVMDEQDE